MLSIRPTVEADTFILEQWRNDPLTRSMSKNTDPVEWKDHCAWVDRRIKDNPPSLFIAMDGNQRVGTFRVDAGEISYTIAPGFRGMGYAKAMLTAALERFGPLRAEIKAENTASIKAAEKAGHIVVLI